MNGSLYIEIYTRKFEKYFCTINAILALKKAPRELLRAYVLLDTETIYVKYCAWKFNIHLNLRFHFKVKKVKSKPKLKALGRSAHLYFLSV